MRYPTGHKISEEVYQAIRFITKVGVMSRTTWYELFGSGSLRWKQKQLQRLIELEIFKSHPCTHIDDVMIIGELGKKLVEEKKWSSVPSVSAQYIEHDEIVARGIWKLEQQGICRRWLTDKEIKQSGTKNFQLNTKDISSKFPDIVFQLNRLEDLDVVAVEYEKTVKSNWRYNKAIKAYSDSLEFDRVLYIVESKAIEQSVKRAMRFIGNSNLNRKIYFIQGEDWKQNPVTALGGTMKKVE